MLDNVYKTQINPKSSNWPLMLIFLLPLIDLPWGHSISRENKQSYQLQPSSNIIIIFCLALSLIKNANKPLNIPILWIFNVRVLNFVDVVVENNDLFWNQGLISFHKKGKKWRMIWERERQNDCIREGKEGKKERKRKRKKKEIRK